MAKKGVEKQEKVVVKEEPKVEVKEEAKEETKLTPEQEKEIMSEPIEGYDKKTVDNPDFFIEETKEKPKEPQEEEKAEEKEEAVAPAEEKSEKPEPPKEELFDKLERELAKSEGKENLGEFSDREKAYFWQMRRDRRARQKAEEERDILRFEKVKRSQIQVEPPKEEAEPDILKGRDEEDFITVKDLKALADKINKKETPKGEPQPVQIDPIRANWIKRCDENARDKFEDYDEVLSIAPEIIGNSPAYLMRLEDAVKNGDNPAVTAYHLIKGDPDFESTLEKKVGKKELPPKEEKEEEPNPEQVKKVEVAKRAQEKMEINSHKPKTSGHAGGSEISAELSLEQAMKMSDKEFRNLPKNKRESLLKAYGA